ncbi:MAG: Holliday junction branch migration protein RuvA [Rhodothermales bacterium]|nr:Holliday junction branch migration protein RuvA [Rhodothermales bacterium]MBO6778760.1 Holliday junction branch migration protein RuvA [Rhodothermales bacterium]
MIERLAGRLVEKRPTEIVIDVRGVGYGLLIPTSTFEALSKIGSDTEVFTHLHVREDILQLYGFASRNERTVFRIMLAVSGVGPKLALAALSAMRPGEIRRHVLAGDAGFLTRIPGVGKKTAERLVIELRDRLAKVDLGDGTSDDTDAAEGVNDALAALEALGFSRSAADKAVRSVLKSNPEATSAEALIRLALRDQ